MNIKDFERNLVVAFWYALGNKGEAASTLGISDRTMHIKAQNWGFKPRKSPTRREAVEAFQELSTEIESLGESLRLKSPESTVTVELSKDADPRVADALREADRKGLDVYQVLREAISASRG